MITGRYPWGAGFYDMNADTNHCTTNYTALPELLKREGYRTHALGKWDVGFLEKKCSATERGFDTFFGYYDACQADYWYHGASGGYPPNCTMKDGTLPTDLSNSTSEQIEAASPSLHGIYNTQLFGAEAARLVRAHPVDKPFYMYLAFMSVHDGCETGEEKTRIGGGKQAPLATVEKYSHTTLDTYKVAGAMYTEMDTEIGRVIAALKEKDMWGNTVVVFVADNGGPLDHCTNAPLRGGKHTFYEGGVRVTGFISGPQIPTARKGQKWHGMAASADWYHTVVEGMGGGKVPEKTGPRPPDGFNLWPSIISGNQGPRREVVHQVENQYSCDFQVKAPGHQKQICSSAIRIEDLKLIIGNPGDSRTVPWPELAHVPVPFGKTGGRIENGTDHARALSTGQTVAELQCKPYCLFNLTSDLGEQHDLANEPSYKAHAERLLARLKYHGSTGLAPAYIWQNLTEWQEHVNTLCVRSEASGVMEPLDVERQEL